MESFSEALKQERNALKEARKRRFRRVRKAAAVLAMSAATAAASAAGLSYLNKSGDLKVAHATAHSFEEPDNNLRVVSWNMHNQAIARIDEIKELIESENPDVIMLQEVNAEDANLLHYALPEWNIAFGLADTKQEFLKGGFGDVIMTRQEIKSAKSFRIKGDSAITYIGATILGAGADAVHLDPSLKESKSKEKENREALVATIEVPVGDQSEGVFATSHITNHASSNPAQLKKLLTIIKGSAVFCGDLNASPSEVIWDFIDSKFRVPKTGHTSVNDPVTIDYCAGSRSAGLGTTKILKQFKTDHYAIEGNWPINIDNPSLLTNLQPDQPQLRAAEQSASTK